VQPAIPEDSVSPRILFRTVAIAEAVTWTLLIAGMIGKYVLDLGGLGVTVGGSAHGLVAIAYVLTVVLVGINQRWSLGVLALAAGSAVLPYVSLPFEIWAARTGTLDGGWRREATADRADHTVPARAVRWLVRRPVTAAVILVVTLGSIMTTLLMIGPPGK
jgi:integral membrane protein